MGTSCRLGRSSFTGQHGDGAHDVRVPSFHAVPGVDRVGVAHSPRPLHGPAIQRIRSAWVVYDRRGGRTHLAVPCSLRPTRCIVDRSGSRDAWRIRSTGRGRLHAALIPGMQKNGGRYHGSLVPPWESRPPRIWTSQPEPFPCNLIATLTSRRTRLLSHNCPPRPRRGATRCTRVESACGLRPRVHTPRRSADSVGAGVCASGDADSEQPIHFNGRAEKLRRYYNPSPLPMCCPAASMTLARTRRGKRRRRPIPRRPYAEGDRRLKRRHLHCRRRRGRR